MAKKLDDVVYLKIYLEGDLPPGFRRLRNSVREILDEFRVYSGSNIEYEFIDPSANPNEKERMSLYKQLSEKGLNPTNLEERGKDQSSRKIIFPGAILNYKSKEMALTFLKSRMGSSPEEMLNISIEGLEYEIAGAIRRLTTPVATHIGFLQGHNELDTRHISDAARALSEFYKIDTVRINGRLDALHDFQALIIAKPDSQFDEKDKFIIDQFIMNGGRVLWAIDRMEINLDSLQENGTNVAIPNELNLDDQLFHYGVRINPDLVLDLQAAPIPVITGYTGNTPKQQLFPWYYFPLFNPESKNPIVHNLNAIKCEFVSSLDTIEVPGVQKTILLTSSKFSRLQPSPARVSLNMLREDPDPSQFNRHGIPVAVLLEGTFTSNYKNRIPDAVSESKEIGFKETSSAGKMIVISDGDVISNFVSKKGSIFPLGYDRYTNQTFGNKNFLLNCMDYLCDDSGVLALRAKEFKLRLLDPAKVADSSFIRWFSVLVPVLLMMIAGFIRNLLRRKKYKSVSGNS